MVLSRKIASWFNGGVWLGIDWVWVPRMLEPWSLSVMLTLGSLVLGSVLSLALVIMLPSSPNSLGRYPAGMHSLVALPKQVPPSVEGTKLGSTMGSPVESLGTTSLPSGPG